MWEDWRKDYYVMRYALRHVWYWLLLVGGAVAIAALSVFVF